jgi:glutaminyl-tRNA synthetase
LFKTPNPGSSTAIEQELNEESLRIIEQARVEPMLIDASANEKFQFERLGYFSVDPKLSEPGRPVFNRVVTLRDTWARLEREHLAAIRADSDRD